MEDVEIVEYVKKDLSNSLLVVAFPTVGLVSSIAGHFIIDTLKLEYIGAILSKDLMPATIIHKGIPSPPVRIYAGDKKCGPNGECEQIAVIISEFMPPYNIIKPLADKIIEWARKKGIKTIVSLEGIHALEGKKEIQIYGVASNSEMKKLLQKYNIVETKEGMIAGVNGVLLYQGALLRQDIICLLSETHASYPDSRAAASLIEKIDVMLPGIKIDPEPLYKEAEEIEKRIQRFIKQSKPTAPSIASVQPYMYG